MTDTTSTSSQTADARRRRVVLASVLAGLVALGVALTVLLTNLSANGSTLAGQPMSPVPTGAISAASTGAPTPDLSSGVHGGEPGYGVAGAGGSEVGSGGGSSRIPSGRRTTPPVMIPSFDLHAYPTGPVSVDESLCPAHLSFAAVISVDRGPMSVTYRWIRSDGGQSSIGRVNFTGAGAQVQTVFSTWDLSADYSGSEHLQVLTPIASSAAVMPFSVHCAPTVTASSVWAAPAAGTCDSLATTLHATVTIGRTPVQVRYHWVIDGHAYPEQNLLGTAVATHTISDPLTFSTTVHGRSLHPVRLVIDSPSSIVTSGGYMSVDCA